jgi:hypothetical protein
MPTTFLVAWIAAQVGSILMLWIGSRIASHRYLIWMGQIAHQRKMVALDKYWPLTKIRPAVTRGDQTTCTVILSLLIAAKSLMCLCFGIVVLFWLPLASLIVPSIVTVHDPNDKHLMSWIRWVAILQVTSHTLAAALGFAVVVEATSSSKSIIDVLRSNALLASILVLLSLGFALAAGKSEASGLMKRGI